MEATDTFSALKKLEEIAGSSIFQTQAQTRNPSTGARFKQNTLSTCRIFTLPVYTTIVTTKVQDGYRRFKVFHKLRTELSHLIWDLSLAAEDPRFIKIT
jgi:hypothetical protein